MPRITQSSSIPNMTGALVDGGSLRLVKHIGTGAFGAVYMGQENSSSSSPSSSSSSSSLLAVKCLIHHRPESAAAKLQARELSLHQRASGHENIVSFHRTFCDPGFVYFVMEYVEGTNMYAAMLDGVYHRETALIKNTFAGLVDALTFCHSQGVYHRDLKPENVLVDANGGNPRLTDFGLATDQAVCTDMGCGSGSYMAPEIFSTSGSTYYLAADADAWALSIILINFVTAMMPWISAQTRDGAWRDFKVDPEFLREMLPISASLNDLLVRCLRVDPIHRPSLDEMRSEVLAMQHLYMSDAELRKASNGVRRCAEGKQVGRRTPPQALCRECGLAASECGLSNSETDSGYSSLLAREQEIRWGKNDAASFVPAVCNTIESLLDDDDVLEPPMAPFAYPSASSSLTDSLSGRPPLGQVHVRVRLSPGPSPLSSSLDLEDGVIIGAGKKRKVSSTGSKMKKLLRRFGTWRNRTSQSVASSL
ncbi:protein serine threonine kinase [Favolaschia claudopus]|uniref:Protein serine threonine kinase n=1 Tax=Favolaschia claudopus TaxID=2862362 RepID=A0AAW0DWX7_9AGAR